MIDLTPLDVRNKRGDFRKPLRGYDPQEVDTFLELVAERLEQLVRENVQLRERCDALEREVSSQTGRERAVQEALVTAQELRSEMRAQAQREADLIVGEARTEARRLVAEAEADARTRVREAERRIELGRSTLDDLERQRLRFLRAFRQLLERELDGVEVEESRAALDERAIELDLRGGRGAAERGEPARDDPGVERAGPDREGPEADAAAEAWEAVASLPAEGAADPSAPPAPSELAIASAGESVSLPAPDARASISSDAGDDEEPRLALEDARPGEDDRVTRASRLDP